MSLVHQTQSVASWVWEGPNKTMPRVIWDFIRYSTKLIYEAMLFWGIGGALLYFGG